MSAFEDASVQVGRCVEEERVGAIVSIYAEAVDRYYTSYDRYLASYGRGAGVGRECSSGISSMGRTDGGLVPPVWVGDRFLRSDLLPRVGEAASRVADDCVVSTRCIIENSRYRTESGVDVGGRTDDGVPGHVASLADVCERDNRFQTILDDKSKDADSNDMNKPSKDFNASKVTASQNVRGKNFERNQEWKQKRKERKEKNKKMQSKSWRSSSPIERVETGFWNSCEPATRKALIESKARMHAAENLRKAKEAEQKCADMDSPFNTVVKAVKMIEFAQKQAEKENDSKVYGWAKTIATSSAESLAKTTPSSIPSFVESDEKLVATSQSSFDLTFKAKYDEIAATKKKMDDKICALNSTIEDLEMELVELKLVVGQRESFGLKTPSSVQVRESPEPVRGCGKKFVKTKKQPWPHVQLTRADIHEGRYF